MAWYKLYFFNLKGHISRALDIECLDDEDAVRRMGEHRHAHALELWQRERRIMRFERNPEDSVTPEA